MPYQADRDRYSTTDYARVGRTGLKLPRVSMGLWNNFGADRALEGQRAILRRAFDLGITHFDLANNYGPEPGSAEETFGRILHRDLATHRDELIISNKAGYLMWPGPYGIGGSRKYLIASLDQSLTRMGLDYVDIFYHHVPDPETPLEESMLALEQIVRQGKALYVGISSYPADLTRQALRILRELRVPFIIHQPKYSMLDRWVEPDLLNVLREEGLGCIAFSPLAQGLLTSRYLRDIPADSRAAKPHGFLSEEAVTELLREKLVRLDVIARARGQSLAQLALVWVLRDDVVTSAIIGASRVAQLEENVRALDNMELSPVELAAIDRILVGAS